MESMSSKQIIQDIRSMKTQALKLLDIEKPYDDLLRTIIREKHSHSNPMSIAFLAGLTGLRYEKLRKYLNQIYYDLVLDSENMNGFEYKKVQYLFWAKIDDKYLSLDVDSLPVMPRVGEEVEIPYFKAYLKRTSFYVKKITHSLLDEEQFIVFDLEESPYNLYWHYQRDKAEEEGKIGFLEKFNLSDSEMKAKLGIGKYRHL